MATAGTIAVNVVANTGGFAAGLGRAQSSLAGFGQSLGGGLRGIGGFSAGMIGIGSAAAIATGAILGVAKAFSHMDDVAKQAKQLGTTVNELLRLEGVAAQADVSVESLVGGLGKMARKVGEARAGSSEAANALAKLGLSADEMANMSPEKAIGQIADAIQALPTAADQAAAAVSIFGKSGADLLPMLQDGSAGIAEMGQRYEELAGTLSGFDEDAIGMANDSWDELKIAAGGLANSLLGFVAPALHYTFEALTLVAQATREVIESIKWLLGNDGAVKAPTETVGGSREAANAFWDEQTKKAEEAKKSAEKFANEMKRIKDQQMQQGASIGAQFASPVEALAMRMRDLNQLLDVGAINWATYQRAVAGANQEMEDSIKAKNKIDTAPDRQVGAVGRGTSAAFSAIQTARSAATKQAEIQKQQLETERKILDTLKSIEASEVTRPRTVSL